MATLISVLFAILGLGFLIFIHELGHYWMARRVGMRVEVFSIGFGRPLMTWKRENGEMWQLGWLPFGGFVKIAGTEKEFENPYKIKDGFFGKTPWDRIKVAFAGPLANILFAILAFSALWILGGREKSFSEYTSFIGWIDPSSPLYKDGVRPGDEIVSYNKTPYRSSRDHIYAAITADGNVAVNGEKVNYLTQEKVPFTYSVKAYPHPGSLDADLLTVGILQPASFLLFDPSFAPTALLPGTSPVLNSGIEKQDQLVWADGELLFSLAQLNHIVQDQKALLTVQRGETIFLRRVPRVAIEDIKLDSESKEELSDWQHEADLQHLKLSKLLFIPYFLTIDNVVQKKTSLLNKPLQSGPTAVIEESLQEGDKILAVDGKPIERAYDLFQSLQEKKVHIIVLRHPDALPKMNIHEANQYFVDTLNLKQVAEISSTIGTNHLVRSSGLYHLLEPIQPKARSQVLAANHELEALEKQQQQEVLSSIRDAEKRAEVERLFQEKQKQPMLGLVGMYDLPIVYNPMPWKLFLDSAEEIFSTLGALVTGSLNPKWISGPLGIVQVISDRSSAGVKEAMFWLGLISLNLALLNLLPIPVLDGGSIFMAAIEWITGKQLSIKAMERLILPFALLLFGLLLYLTFNDLSRLLMRFWG